MATTAENVKLPDLITRWMEVQKSRAGFEDGSPLKVDVIDLTLLLKSMGLKLEYLDFEEEKSNTDSLTVDIRCHKSGVMARMSYDLVDCSCPEKDEKETSFWEVQATGPSVFSKHKNNTSSNLLPEVSESCSMVSKAMLSNLLDYYRSSMKSIERGEDVLQSPLKVAMPRICVSSPISKENRISIATPPAEGKFMALIESVASPEKQTEEIISSPPKTTEQTKDDTKSDHSVEGVGIDNTTKELSKSDSGDKPVISMEPTPNKSQESRMPDDSSFANSEAMKALITSSPNEKVLDSVFNADQNHERDLNVIHCLQQARQEIDTALLVMKLNNSHGGLPSGSIITTTPQTVVRKKLATPLLPERSSSLTNINRRMSLPGHPSPSPRIVHNPSVPKKYTNVTSKLASVRPAVRGDTPRPTTAQVKTITLLRKTSSSASISTIGSSSAATKGITLASKKGIGTATKPIGSVKTAPSKPVPMATGVTRSKSSATIVKK
ncbi:protein PRRC2C-like [Wyeomyia smithii]|uniref:protein PRRC2C-like n=1 Tax=Wyeomyia smithii TaxID=174621 RepID=UPI002467C628|nr:protein PRRC2C-like [Wyeomyia smithii]